MSSEVASFNQSYDCVDHYMILTGELFFFFPCSYFLTGFFWGGGVFRKKNFSDKHWEMSPFVNIGFDRRKISGKQQSIVTAFCSIFKHPTKRLSSHYHQLSVPPHMDTISFLSFQIPWLLSSHLAPPWSHT